MPRSSLSLAILIISSLADLGLGDDSISMSIDASGEVNQVPFRKGMMQQSGYGMMVRQHNRVHGSVAIASNGLVRQQAFVETAGEKDEEHSHRDAPIEVSRNSLPSLTNATATSRAQRLLQMAYSGHDTDTYASINDAKAEDEVAHVKGSDAEAAVYGEILPASVIKMLKHVSAQPGQKYCDLGCGYGKTAVLAFLLGLDAMGVELATEREAKACGALPKLKKALKEEEDEEMEEGIGLKFVKASFTDVDFSDCDIVFTDSVLFSHDLLESLAKGARKMKPGASIVSADGLPGPGFEHVKKFIAESSWDEESEWTLQKVSSEPSLSERGVAGNSKADESICRL